MTLSTGISRSFRTNAALFAKDQRSGQMRNHLDGRLPAAPRDHAGHDHGHDSAENFRLLGRPAHAAVAAEAVDTFAGGAVVGSCASLAHFQEILTGWTSSSRLCLHTGSKGIT